MKYYIITYGCQMNESDSERIAAVLEKSGLSPAKTEDWADFIIINMCSVRQRSVDKIFKKISVLKSKNKRVKVLLTGCFLENDKKDFEKFTDLVFKIDELQKLSKFLDKKYNFEKKHYLKIIPKYGKPSFRTQAEGVKFAYVPIMTGCNNFCAYCVVPYTRKREVSRQDKDIVTEIKKLVKNDYKTIWLLGQNVNSYKYRNLNFPKLLEKIEKIPGDFEVSFLTSHPKDFSDDLIDVITTSKKIKKYIHLPVQAGSNKILKRMNRNYTREHYLGLIKKIKERIPGVEISTDIIVGFPGETKKDFEETVDLVGRSEFSKAYINPYSPRPGTVAAKLKDNVTQKEKEKRENVLRSFFMKPKKTKLIVILGPTASGKSDLAVQVAKSFDGEIISADSRQVYKGMDIGTGKITKKEMQGIAHHLLDIISPKSIFTVAQYKKLAKTAIEKIQNKNKIPILCGGTGFYIQAVVDGIIIPKVKPDWKLRNSLEKKSNSELFEMLENLDPVRAKNIDKDNTRRLIRAIEIFLKTKKPVPEIKKSKDYNVLIIGIKKSKEELRKLIEKRLKKRTKQGMVKEVEKLHKSGISWKRLESFGLEYKWIAKYLQNKVDHKKMVERIQKESEQYAKRQITWFKRDKRIRWIKNQKEAEKIIKSFL